MFQKDAVCTISKSVFSIPWYYHVINEGSRQLPYLNFQDYSYSLSRYEGILKPLKFLKYEQGKISVVLTATLKSLINEQGGYEVFLVLSEYLFIRDFRVIC